MISLIFSCITAACYVTISSIDYTMVQVALIMYKYSIYVYSIAKQFLCSQLAVTYDYTFMDIFT